MLECEKLSHDVIDEKEHENNVMSKIKEIKQEAEMKIKTISDHVSYVKKQMQKIKDAMSVCKSEIEKTHMEAVARLAERKKTLLKECDEHESALLQKLDALAKKDNKLVSSLSNASELVSNGVKGVGTGQMMEAHETLCDRLKDILKIDDPDLSEATAITERGEGLYFNEKHNDFDLGELQVVKWKEKINVKISKYEMWGTAPTPDGRMAVGCDKPGGIKLYSAEGELQQTVLEDVDIRRILFLSDGRCVVRDWSYNISLYKPEWKKLDVRFDSLNETGGGLAVDCDDLIYVGYRMSKKIRVFTPSGGKAIREISCGGYEPWQISVMEPSKMLVVRVQNKDIRLLDQQGKEMHSVAKDSHTYTLHATVCKDGTILSLQPLTWSKTESVSSSTRVS